MSAASPAGLVGLMKDRRGVIVLGPLIVFALLLVVMVVGGKIIYPEPRGTYRTPPAPELLYAVAPGEVYAADRVAMRLRPGDQVWVVRLDNGAAVVFRDRTAREVIGVTRALLGAARSGAPVSRPG